MKLSDFYNANEVKVYDISDRIADGWHSFRVIDTKWDNSYGSPVLKIFYTVLGGDDDEKTFVDQFKLAHQSEKAANYAKIKLKKMHVACGLDQLNDESELLNKVFRGEVQSKPHAGNDGIEKIYQSVEKYLPVQPVTAQSVGTAPWMK